MGIAPAGMLERLLPAEVFLFFEVGLFIFLQGFIAAYIFFTCCFYFYTVFLNFYNVTA
jgi:hypothetical protein